MPLAPITAINDLTPEWLTSALSDAGALEEGRVVELEEVERKERDLSLVLRFEPRYSEGAIGERPAHLFLKICKTDLDDWSFGPSEVHYYTRDYVGVEGVPLVRCYAASFSEELGSYYLLLDDHSPTHQDGFMVAPTLDYSLAVAEGLARLHAPWWGAERLAEAPIPTAAQIERYVAIARPGVEPQIELMGDELEPHWPRLIHEVYEHHPRLMIERTQDPVGFTLVHGDPNPTNILQPREGPGPIYLIDRQPFDWSLTTWLAASDLSYVTVNRWAPRHRRKFELPFLQRYHDELVALAVDDYPWERLLADYRLSIVQSLYIANEWCTSGELEGCTELKWGWDSLLTNVLRAIDDHDAARLWHAG